MSSVKSVVNLVLMLFILFSIPVTVFVSRRANLNSSASTLSLSVNVSPKTQSLTRGSSALYYLDLNFSDQLFASQTPLLLRFDNLPTGVSLNPQPIGATPSNHFQKNHTFNLVASPTTPPGVYKVEVTATDMTRTQKTSFSFTIK